MGQSHTSSIPNPKQDIISVKNADIKNQVIKNGDITQKDQEKKSGINKESLDIRETLDTPKVVSQPDLKAGSWWENLVSGGIAGVVSRTSTAPLDRLKIHLQVHGGKNTNMRTCLNAMLKEGGVWSLWRGNAINVIKIAPESGLKFMAFEQAKLFIMKNKKTQELDIYERFVAGAVAGAFSQTMIYPLEVLKTRLALRKTGEYKSILDAAIKIIRREGLRTMYRGFLPNILGIIPYAGIDLAVYETLRNYFMKRQGSTNETPSAMVTTACGAVSSACGLVATYPLALIRTKLQAETVPSAPGGKPSTMTSIVRNILKKEGLVGLYRGIVPNFLKVIPAVCITYVVYEKCEEGLKFTKNAPILPW